MDVRPEESEAARPTPEAAPETTIWPEYTTCPPLGPVGNGQVDLAAARSVRCGSDREHPGDEIRYALSLLSEPGQVVELRSLNTRWKTVSGYYDDMDKLAEDALTLDGKVPAVYVTLNPLPPALLARASNRFEKNAREATGDQHIVRRSWLPLDFDPVRPSGISSTGVEHAAAMERAVQAQEWLRERGWPQPIRADSGNGAHLVYRIDLPNDVEALTLVNRCLEAVAFAWGDGAVSVDQKVGNAGRIWKLWGTMVSKGDDTPERPHRRSRILSAPDCVEVVPHHLLLTLAALRPPTPLRRFAGHKGGSFDLEEWISTNGLPVATHGPWLDGGWRWVLNPCPWNPEHADRAAYVVRLPNGAIQAGCHHDGCRGKDWQSLRGLYEPAWRADRPDWRERRELPAACLPDRQGKTGPGTATCEASGGAEETAPWPDPPAPEAFYGLPGELVRTIEPHSEADRAALLLQLLAGFGNAAGRSAHYRVEADQHFLNFFVCLVGATAKSRKGTSWGQVRAILTQADPEWAERCTDTGLSSGEGLIWRVRDPIKTSEPVREKGTRRVTGYESVVTDEGVTDKRLLVVQTELASTLRVLQREGNTLSPVLREAWDTGRLSTIVKHNPARATNAHVSVIAHVTKDEAQRYLTATEQANGFGNRFLWACVRRSKILPEGGKLREADLGPLVKRLRAALDFASLTREITWNEEARAEWYEIYPALSEGKPGLGGALVARAEAQVVRLAAAYACLDLSSAIRLPHLQAALAMWNYCERSARFVFGTSLGDPVADEILSALRSAPDGLSRTDIRDLSSRHWNAQQIARGLTTLTGLGLAYWQKVETGGRPSERWYAVATKATEVHLGEARGRASVASVAGVAEVPRSDSTDTGGDKSDQSPPINREGEDHLVLTGTCESCALYVNTYTGGGRCAASTPSKAVQAHSPSCARYTPQATPGTSMSEEVPFAP